jgi:hypothetical protein
MRKNVLPDFRQRQDDAASAKKAILAKFRAIPGPDDPAVAERRMAREALLAERAARAAQREAAKRAHEAQLAEQAIRAAELAAQAEREAAEARARAEAERIERYAARKQVKKQWRKGLQEIKQTLHARP